MSNSTKSMLDFKKDLIQVYMKHGFGANTIQTLSVRQVFSEYQPSTTICKIADDLDIKESNKPRLLELMEE